MEQSPRLSLSYVMPAQAQKHVTVNETFRRLDALTQLAVLSRILDDEPTNPNEGDAYILPKSTTGIAWQNFKQDNIAVFQDGAWVEVTGVTGMRAWLIDEAILVVYDRQAWTNVTSADAAITEPRSQTAPTFGINTAADETNRLAVKSDAVLFSHDDVTPGNDDCRLHINKANGRDTGSMIFQTGFSARAELGLAGTDDFIIKVSADGASWTNAINIDANTGHVGFGSSSPSALLHVNGGGAVFGNPTGGDKGNGTINAQGLYDDNALLSCYVFDQALDGDIDESKWDVRAPSQRHEPMQKFKSRIESVFDPLTLDGYAKHWREKRHLSAMPNEATFDPAKGLATGAWIQRLVETVEVQAVLIEALNQRLKNVENARATTQP